MIDVDQVTVRRGQASLVLDTEPHVIELRLQPDGELLWSEEVWAAELSHDDRVVMLPIEGWDVESPGVPKRLFMWAVLSS